MILAVVLLIIGGLLAVIAWLLFRRGRTIDELDEEVSRLKIERQVMRAALAKVGDRILEALDEELADDPAIAELARRLSEQ